MLSETPTMFVMCVGNSLKKKSFVKLSDAKLKEGVFVGSQIRNLLIDPTFDTKLTDIQLAAWYSFKPIRKDIFGNRKENNYVPTINDLLNS